MSCCFENKKYRAFIAIQSNLAQFLLNTLHFKFVKTYLCQQFILGNYYNFQNYVVQKLMKIPKNFQWFKAEMNFYDIHKCYMKLIVTNQKQFFIKTIKLYVH